MRRREFLASVGKVIVILPAGATWIACENNNNTAGGAPPGTPVDASVPRDLSTPAAEDMAGQPAPEEDMAQQPADMAMASGSLQWTSTVVSAHSHTFAITMATLASPPGGGLQQSTGAAQGHVHTVTLTQADLATIDGGGTVVSTTSIAVGHDHMFTFSRATGTPLP
jgi:hypothetical protein